MKPNKPRSAVASSLVFKFLGITTCLAVVALGLWGLASWYLDERKESVAQSAEYAQAASHTPEIKTKTLQFLPGQSMDIPNPKSRKVEVKSEYPLRVLTGPCHSEYTVDFVCEDDPTDIEITDVRHVPITLKPSENKVTVTVTEF